MQYFKIDWVLDNQRYQLSGHSDLERIKRIVTFVKCTSDSFNLIGSPQLFA